MNKNIEKATQLAEEASAKVTRDAHALHNRLKMLHKAVDNIRKDKKLIKHLHRTGLSSKAVHLSLTIWRAEADACVSIISNLRRFYSESSQEAYAMNNILKALKEK